MPLTEFSNKVDLSSNKMASRKIFALLSGSFLLVCFTEKAIKLGY